MLRHTFRLGARRFIPGYILLLLMVCLVLVLNRSSAIPVQQPKIQQDGGSISCKKPFTVIHHQLLVFLKTLNLLLKPRSYKYNMGITLNAF
ncbi:uncharacterized protein LOC133745161 isoform X3 [Rosa rugosa]|uniref:uncharacterized protein LOC133745161 isoform X3 n=1 Tax=Rosa rugosa TaxID=74645 RepID=UPI002B40AF1F|nr:uncharacterized protein LOC133745161 isoform X3 [Rosa rugosa]